VTVTTGCSPTAASPGDTPGVSSGTAAVGRASAVAVLAVALVVGLAAPVAAQTSVEDDVRGAQVVVVGVPGLRWDDVDPRTTPVLHRLAQTSAVGVLSVKAAPAVSCAADGWLTLGAGNRAEAFGVACGELPGAETLDEQRRRNRATREAADPGALAEALRDAGTCVAALGPGAELAAGVPAVPADGRCDVVLVGATPREPGAADTLVGVIDAALDPGSTLLVVGLSETPADDRAHLHVALASGDRVEPGALRSASTRRAPYVQLVDVAPTVLDLVGVAPAPSMVGEPWRSVGTPPAVAELADLADRAVDARRATVPFVAVLVGALLAAFAVARLVRSWRLAEVAGLAAVGAVAGSYLAGLVPWWRTPAPLVALLVVAAAVGGVAALLVHRVRAPVAAAGAVTGGLALVLVLDLLTGARLQVDTPLGYSPLVAGRFAGIGNVGFGVFAAAVLLALAAATAGRSPRAALTVVASGGLVAVVVDGAPRFGSDVGGVLALVPAVVLLALLRTGTRVSAIRLLAAGLAGAAVVTAFALLDYARAADDRTHLGRFVQDIVDGTAGTVLRRKTEAVVDLLFANPVTALLPVVVAAAVLLVVRSPRPLQRAFDAAPAWRHGLLVLGAAAAIGFVVNDSGTAVPATALLVAAPATVSVVSAVAARRGEFHDPAR
jgi:hypothetical protein